VIATTAPGKPRAGPPAAGRDAEEEGEEMCWQAEEVAEDVEVEGVEEGHIPEDTVITIGILGIR
jgi:hypothetical protein